MKMKDLIFNILIVLGIIYYLPMAKHWFGKNIVVNKLECQQNAAKNFTALLMMYGYDLNLSVHKDERGRFLYRFERVRVYR